MPKCKLCSNEGLYECHHCKAPFCIIHRSINPLCADCQLKGVRGPNREQRRNIMKNLVKSKKWKSHGEA